MGEKKGIVLHRGKVALLVILSLLIGIVVCGILVIRRYPPDLDYSTPMPTRQFTAPKLVRPQVVNSTWNFETVFSPKMFDIPRQGWLAVDSKGHPAMAYGGNQLNYAWFDGSTWHILKIDGRPGSGKYARLLFDANDQPHIVYSIAGAMGLGYMHRDAQGWHQEVIDPDSCNIGSPNIAFDHQGNLIVVYVYNPSCTGSNVYTQEIHIAEQTPQAWQIQKIGRNGASPSIAIDRSGQIHIAYELAEDNHLVELVRQKRGEWVTNELVKKNDFLWGFIPSIMVDTNLCTHVIYSDHDPDHNGWYNLYHTWMDKTGWHTEQIGNTAFGSASFSTYIDSADRIYVLYSDGRPRLKRRDSSGWQDISPSGSSQGEYSAVTLAVDQKEQVHLAYFNSANYTIYYSVQQDGQWQIKEIDHGDKWDLDTAGTAFDQEGRLHISFMDEGQSVHYLSQEQPGWQDEIAGQVDPGVDRSAELLFDNKGIAHIFYVTNIPPVGKVDSSLIHVYQRDTGWVRETVPVKSPDGFPYHSPFVISPEGWLAFVEINSYSGSVYYRYRTPDGWKDTPLPAIHSTAPVRPVIAFPVSTSNSNSVETPHLPDIFYFNYRTNALLFSTPGKDKPQVVPLLNQNEYLETVSLQYSKQGFPFLFVRAVKGSTTLISENLRFSTYENGFHQTYQMNGIPEIREILSDARGSLHFAYMEGSQSKYIGYYLTGNDLDWKKSGISGLNESQPDDPYALIGTAVDAGGKFCMLLDYFQSFRFEVGCLQSIQ